MQTFSDNVVVVGFAVGIGFDSLPSNNTEKMASMCSPRSPHSRIFDSTLIFSLSLSHALTNTRLSHSPWNALLLLLHFEKGEEIE